VIACDRRQLVRHFLPRIREAFLDDHHAEAPADPEKGPAAWVSSLVPEATVPRGPGTRLRLLGAGRLVPPRLTPLGIRLLALLWALIVGQAAVAGNLATREEGPSPSNSVQTATTGKAQSGSPDRVDRLGCGWTLRWHKRLHAFPRIAPLDDPNDDETSDDPNDDDDAWDDLNGDDETDGPIIAWFRETVHHRYAPEYAPITWTAPPSLPFLMQRRLRC
jgi:hypothetical protein